MSTKISLKLDMRRPKLAHHGKVYPVKLQVYYNALKDQRLISTPFDLTERDFIKATDQRPRKEFKALAKKLKDYQRMAEGIAEQIEPFNFDIFKRKLRRDEGGSGNVVTFYKEYITELRNRDQIGTALNYRLSITSLLLFHDSQGVQEVMQRVKASEFLDEYKGKLHFSEINKSWLEDYEAWMFKQRKSPTTISMYLRALRTIFKRAIAEQELEHEIYPFGLKAYIIPTGSKTLKALDKNELKILLNAKPTTSEQERALDFWLLSYLTNGSNMADIASWRWSNIYKEQLSFIRKKTRRTTKLKPKTIQIELTAWIQRIIDKYGNEDKRKDALIFDFITINAKNEEQRRTKIQAFTRFVNQHIKTLAESLGIQVPSTNWARHSYVSRMYEAGIPIKDIGEAVGHSKVTTTDNYVHALGLKARLSNQNKILTDL